MSKEFEKELLELSPFLADLKKQSPKEPFRTPRLYFDTLADKVIENAKTETVVAQAPPLQRSPIGQYKARFSLFSRLNNWFSAITAPRFAMIAGSLALFVAAGWYIVHQQKPTMNTDTATTEEVKMYINEHIDEFKEEDILTAVADNKSPKIADNGTDKKSIELTLPTPNVQDAPSQLAHPKSGLTEEELEEYLKENLDENDIEPIGGKL